MGTKQIEVEFVDDGLFIRISEDQRRQTWAEYDAGRTVDKSRVVYREEHVNVELSR